MPTYYKLICKDCNSIFDALPRDKNKTYCNTLCHSNFKKKNSTKSKLENCLECNTELSGYQTKFCSHTCSAIYNNRNRTREERAKQIASIKKYYLQFIHYCKRCSSIYIGEHACKNTYKRPIKKKYSPRIRFCNHCNIQLENNKKKFCDSCIPTIRYYRSICSFRFNVFDYPTEFDLSLVEKYGWFSPNGYKKRNKTPNLNGVSRDHLYTISDGFKYNIDSTIISHPANCQILQHNGPNGNNSKKKSNITLEELLLKISIWNLKYGAP